MLLKVLTRPLNHVKPYPATKLMQCYSTIPIIQKGERFWVPCGKCNFCLQTRRNDWAFRLTEELKAAQTGHFITLTYDNKHLPMLWEDDVPYDMTLDKEHLSTFHQTIKRDQQRLLGKKGYLEWGKIRFYSVGEYGTRTKRPHYHTVIYNVYPEMIKRLLDGYYWDKGMVHVGTVTPESCAYVAKYVIDREHDHPEGKQKEFATMSRNPGLGHNYLEENGAWHREQTEYDYTNFRIYAIRNGKKVSLPRYYKDRIFKVAEEGKEELLADALTKYYDELSVKFENDYIREIERLSVTQQDPVSYYRQRRKAQHDGIRQKSHLKNSL